MKRYDTNTPLTTGENWGLSVYRLNLTTECDSPHFPIPFPTVYFPKTVLSAFSHLLGSIDGSTDGWRIASFHKLI